MLLGGRTAEEIALGEISTGAQNDLQRATDIARAMVTEFGMSDALGAINYDGNKRAKFLDIPMPQERGLYARGDGAEDRRRDQADPDRRARHGAATSSTSHREKLETVTRRLLEIEVMEGDELRQLLGVIEAPGDCRPGSAAGHRLSSSVRPFFVTRSLCSAPSASLTYSVFLSSANVTG